MEQNSQNFFNRYRERAKKAFDKATKGNTTKRSGTRQPRRQPATTPATPKHKQKIYWESIEVY